MNTSYLHSYPWIKSNLYRRITQTDLVSAPWALSAIAAFYSATCIVLYTHRCSRLQLSHSEHAMLVSHTCNAELSRKCDKQTSTMTNVVDVNWAAVCIINKLGLPPTLLITSHIPACTSAPSWTLPIVADWHKFLALRRLSRRLK